MSLPNQGVVYTAQSKQFFYCRDAVCAYVLDQGKVPLNPFRAFDYFIGDRVRRELVRFANHALLDRADELWVFGECIADGVLEEIARASARGTPTRYFTIDSFVSGIREIGEDDLDFEPEVFQQTGLDRSSLLGFLRAGQPDRLVHALGRRREVVGAA